MEFLELANELIPLFITLAFSLVVVLVTGALKNGADVMSVIFAIMLGASILCLSATNEDGKDSIITLIKAYGSQTDEVKLALAGLCVTCAYFGGGLFLKANITDCCLTSSSTSNNNKSSNMTPASCDTVTSFDVPSKLKTSDKELFKDCFDRFVAEIISDLKPIYEMPDEAVTWIEEMINYTVTGGKMNRGLALVQVVNEFAKQNGNNKPSNKERIQACALGWCIEFLQAFFLVADDVMDDSITRRGQPCWYRRDEVQLIAINDAFILETCVYKILKRYFGDESYYNQLLDLMIETTRQTEFGQLLDLTSQRQDGKIDLDRFTLERYSMIVKYKTAFYSFYLPVAGGMIMAGITDQKLYDTARTILCDMGEYFQVQDDYLDCYGDYETIGKIGTDIQDNKCGWLVVKALEICNSKQRRILENNYGVDNQTKIKAVKNLYKELDIESIYMDYEEESFERLRNLIDNVEGMPKGVFEFLLKKIYKRQK